MVLLRRIMRRCSNTNVLGKQRNGRIKIDIALDSNNNNIKNSLKVKKTRRRELELAELFGSNKTKQQQHELPVEIIANVLSFLKFEEMVCEIWSSFEKLDKALCRVESIRFVLDDKNSDHKLRFAESHLKNLPSIHLALLQTVDGISSDLIRGFLTTSPMLKHFSFKHYCYDFGTYNSATASRYHDVSAALEPIGNAADLKSLKLVRCRFDCVVDIIRLLQNKTQLKSLHLSDTRFGKYSHYPRPCDCNILSSHIATLHNLEELIVSNGWSMRHFDAETVFSNLPCLRKLVVENATDASLVSAARYCPNIEILELRDCRTLTLYGIMEVLRCCPIQTLFIDDFRGTGCGIVTVKELCRSSSRRRCNTLTHLTVNAGLWLDDVTTPTLSNEEKARLMKEAAASVSSGRVTLEVL
eukprot:CAMPEP_0116047676 /NCGR_PEP_ID=MMETSP0321-20121206/29044_1 /TAXON_ID=163516 /ORGANISM="Leptocylindrus danicus var. danicus, Strain B650" /LENGTH=412 /DNA_ID=CAMNT_0003529623 /DNA_START=180 /DNA_END=1419 /DNA_ORIENTATION=-